ncbi:MAG TPA: response regulator, partial [Terriglobales bacterium]|nr:response regulator [Terriglobales bacterium]
MLDAAIGRATSRDEFTSLGSVLIVDDEAAIRESLDTLLEFEGYSVEVAGDGAEGLARIAERPFDLVLLDFAMPERNGIEILRE